jgi:hypothetical protein
MKARCFGSWFFLWRSRWRRRPFAGPEEPIAQLTPILQEGIERRLIQFEVRLSQKGAPVRGVKAADLDIELGGKPLKSFILDDMCTGTPDAVAETAAVPAGSFLLYFDEIELTFEGRRRAVEVRQARREHAVVQGERDQDPAQSPVAPVGNAVDHDAALISATLGRIAGDPGEGDAMRAAIDEARIVDSMDHTAALIHDANINQAISRETAIRESVNGPIVGANCGGFAVRAPNPAALVAAQSAKSSQQAGDHALQDLVIELRGFSHEEVRRGERDMTRLRAAISSLALRGAPKGIVYFADTLRRDPGHVVEGMLDSQWQFTNRIAARPGSSSGLSGTDAKMISSVSSRTADLEMAALVRDAATYGARFFAVEGRNLAAPSDWIQASQDTMVSLALDTGGLPFINGIPAEKIADRIAADQSCWYLASFDPRGWTADKQLGLGVYPKARGVRVNTRSSLVIPSRETLIQATLQAAPLETPVTREAIALRKDP